eukprot:SAG31_NODE_105_length_25008_cov_17.439399_16_plen_198_part_00
MDEEELYLFDLNGYIVVEDVLDAEQLAAANAVVDEYQHARTGDDQTGRRDLRGMLGFPAADRAPFVQMMCHPKLVRFLNCIVGQGFRLDHAPTLLTMETGDPAAGMHGSSGYDSWTGRQGFNPTEYYVWKDGRMHNGLTVAAFQLVDCPPGAGGLGIVCGSHKSNVKIPDSLRNCTKHQDVVKQVVCRAGDVVLFSE